MARRLGGGLLRRIGRRGAFLLFLALVDLSYGARLAQPTEAFRRAPSVQYADQIMPLGLWAALWLGVGLVCAVQAFMRRDVAAFVAAAALKVLVGCVSLFGWLVGAIPDGRMGAVIWLAFAALALLIAGWAENEDRSA